MRFVHIEKDINLTLTNKVWIGHFLSDNNLFKSKIIIEMFMRF